MEYKYQKLSQDVLNIKGDKEYHDSRVETQLKIRKYNIDKNVIKPRLQHARVQQKIFTEKDFEILDDDEQENEEDIKLDIEDEENNDDGLHFNLNYKKEKKLDINIHNLDRYINKQNNK